MRSPDGAFRGVLWSVTPASTRLDWCPFGVDVVRDVLQVLESFRATSRAHAELEMRLLRRRRVGGVFDQRSNGLQFTLLLVVQYVMSTKSEQSTIHDMQALLVFIYMCFQDSRLMPLLAFVLTSDKKEHISKVTGRVMLFEMFLVYNVLSFYAI